MLAARSVLPLVLATGLVLAAARTGAAGVDLASLEVVPQRGQTPDQRRRDRYECHNWAVDQTGVEPSTLGRRAEQEARESRRERLDRVASGAAAGAALGGLIRSAQRRNPARGVLAGAALGAVIAAATDRREDAGEAGTQLDEYLRALTACLEGRGYRVALPAEAAEAETFAAR